MRKGSRKTPLLEQNVSKIDFNPYSKSIKAAFR